jgi:hypothetical protein
MIEIQSPNPIISNGPSIFLAGSIEQDTAENWQKRVIAEFTHLDGCLFNPRRASWDSSLAQDISNPVFSEQVTWELDALAAADWIIMYFDPNTKSPITLLEFGLYITSGKLIVCCPDGFWRKGNIQVCCERAGIKLHETFDEMIEVTKNLLLINTKCPQ